MWDQYIFSSCVKGTSTGMERAHQNNNMLRGSDNAPLTKVGDNAQSRFIVYHMQNSPAKLLARNHEGWVLFKFLSPK